MEKKSYIAPSTKRVALRMHQRVMVDIDYGDPDITSVEGLVINARVGVFDGQEEEEPNTLPHFHSPWEEDE